MGRYLIDEILGKTIIIKSWDDMAMEYGTNENGDEIQISDDIVFDDNMIHLCGKELKIDMTVYRLTYKDNIVDLYNEIVYADENHEKWYICRDMIEDII